MSNTKQTIGGLCAELIKAGKTNEQIIAAVKAAFPGAKTSSASVAWYRSKLGVTAPKVAKAAVTKVAKNSAALYMAYNHNGTPLMKEGGTKAQAQKELREYLAVTGNPPGHVAPLVAEDPKTAKRAKTDDDRMNEIFNDVAGTLDILAVRWADEQEYEDFDEYIKKMDATLTRYGVKFVKLTKRPFAVTMVVGKTTFRVFVKGQKILCEKQVTK